MEFLLFSHKAVCPNKNCFGKEKVPKISIEVGCQVSLVGHHIEEPAVFFVSAVVHISRIGSAVRHCPCNPLTRLLILLRLLRMTSFVWEAEVVEHLLLLFRTSVDCYRRILLNTSLSK